MTGPPHEGRPPAIDAVGQDTLASSLRAVPDPRLLKPREAAKYLGISERSLWAMGNQGEIQQVRFGVGRRQNVRYDLVDLDAWIAKGKQRGR